MCGCKRESSRAAKRDPSLNLCISYGLNEDDTGDELKEASSLTNRKIQLEYCEQSSPENLRLNGRGLKFSQRMVRIERKEVSKQNIAAL